MTSRDLRNHLLLPAAMALCATLSQAQTGTATRIQWTDKSIAYTGNWYTNGSSLNSGGSSALTNAPGATAVVTFTGTGITWIGVLDPWAGIATVYLDGTMSTVDTYGPTTLYQQPVFTVSGLADGPHTLSIYVPHVRDANGQGSWVWVNAFDIMNGSGVAGGFIAGAGRTEQNSPAVTYTGVWLPNNSAVNSGGSAVLATNSGSTATITFNGTGITWVAYRDQSSGIAKVYVDGVLTATVDTYLSPAQAQAPTYTINGLVSGTHSLMIEVTGTHDTSSNESWVWVDAFDVVGTASSLTITHIGNLTQGQPGATYQLSVRNTDTIASSGSVMVTGTLSSSLTATAIGGSGWACNLSSVSCSRSDSLPPGGNYPPIALTVDVAANAPPQITNEASLTGGGLPPATASDLTTILAPFADVSPSDPFLPAIDLMREYGIDPGCGGSPALYCENDYTTRGDMAVFVTRSIMGGDNFTYTATPYFTDVPATHPLFQWIQKMRDLQITAGCGPTTYCPDDSVTRGQMAVFIIRARYGATAAFDSPPIPLFTDVPASNIFFPWIQEMEQLGITSGCGPTTYCPNDPVTQGQISVFLMRGAFNQLLPSNTPVIVSASPATALPGTTLNITLTGQNTHFAGGTTQVSAGAGIAVSGIFVSSATTLTVQITVAGNAAPGPSSITATTGSEDATLPNGFLVQ